MSELKAGDIALVTGGELMVGESVVLLAWINPGERFSDQVLDPAEPYGGWHIKGSDECVKDQKYLMPLRGDFAPEEIREMEKDHA